MLISYICLLCDWSFRLCHHIEYICNLLSLIYPCFYMIVLLLFTPLEFFTSVLADGFPLESEWQQVSSSLQVSSQDYGCSQQCCRLDSLYASANFMFSKPFNNLLVIVPNAPLTIATIVTFMFHIFFNSLARARYLSFFSLSFRFILWSAGTAELKILLIIIRSGLLAGIRWSVLLLLLLI